MKVGFKFWACALTLAATLAACGGGGAGTPPYASSGSGSSAGSGGTTVKTSNMTITLDVINTSGASTNQFTSTEVVRAKVVVQDASNQPVSGAIVTFSEDGGAGSGGSLLKFIPDAATDLTAADGSAFVDVRAADTTKTGATGIVASITSNGTTVKSGMKGVKITAGQSQGSNVNPQSLVTAVNFLDVNPTDKSIVLQGTGGAGRSESAILRFRVVDSNNTPVKGAVANFAVSGDVTLNIASATSDSDGVLVTSVSSKTTPTTAVVTATVSKPDGSKATSQSSQLTVTTGVPTQAGFDLSASQFNLNSGVTGDSSSINVAIRDTNGNPVVDGTPVVFTATHGVVGSSSRGGCVTSNGGCSVLFKVQDPRPADGVLTEVKASTQLGASTLGKSIYLRLVDTSLLALYDAPKGGSMVSTFAGNCGGPASYSGYIGTPQGFPTPAKTVLTVKPLDTDVTGSITTGSPVDDQLGAPSRVRFSFSVDLSKSAACSSGKHGAAEIQLKITSPSSVGASTSTTQSIYVTY